KPFKLITTASADVPLKGLDFTLRAIAVAIDKYPLINLVVIGKPRSGGHTERLISKLGIDELVSFKTNLTNQEVSDEYASSQIAIVSSLYEGFGFPVGEAMACAVPLIATDVASIPEITGPYAEMIAPESHEDIFNSLDNIFQNYDHYMKKANLGRDHILQNFSWPVIANSYIDHISSILTSHADI
ncbi:glycosyltransferase, partial [Gammaproteobacteria bacterium]|nr:glycosyltransferase [Gammaproteobacteria bacterium]